MQKRWSRNTAVEFLSASTSSPPDIVTTLCWRKKKSAGNYSAHPQFYYLSSCRDVFPRCEAGIQTDE